MSGGAGGSNGSTAAKRPPRTGRNGLEIRKGRQGGASVDPVQFRRRKNWVALDTGSVTEFPVTPATAPQVVGLTAADDSSV